MDKMASGYQPRLIVANQQINVTYEPNHQLIDQQRQAELERKIMTLDMSSDIRQASLDDYAKGAPTRQKAVPIVMLDDIGADSMSSWIRDEVLSVILQYRMQEKLPTFFSSNLSMEDLQLHMTVNQRGDYEPLKAARIMERIKYVSREIVVAGLNLRQQTSENG
ncbi:hypothetical protein EQ500_10635 [Lactobacillus sp. XV13L]|nr:hypothetical protein [Lactobacillus sp. XV13L]